MAEVIGGRHAWEGTAYAFHSSYLTNAFCHPSARFRVSGIFVTGQTTAKVGGKSDE